ncbi:hypothetical protein [Ideonella sp. A 288]|uniref:hypothetical protein n=1 Tax=Ideonella sp. A 288 TaxID=1962181 RepID=UPI0011852981|nr:hypothetical protein [Ideonella sp. A 288]
MHRILSTLALAATLGLAGAAQAAVVTFEPDDFVLVLGDGDTHSVEGFDFTLQSGRADASFFVSGLQDPAYVGNGSRTLVAANQANLRVATSSGQGFDLLSFDLGGSFVDFTEAWAESVTVIGHTAAGDLSLTVDLPDLATMATVTLNWLGLSSFELRPNGTPVNDFGPDFSIDNLRVNVVPEPASLAVVALALALAAGVGRRGARPRSG